MPSCGHNVTFCDLSSSRLTRACRRSVRRADRHLTVRSTVTTERLAEHPDLLMCLQAPATSDDLQRVRSLLDDRSQALSIVRPSPSATRPRQASRWQLAYWLFPR